MLLDFPSPSHLLRMVREMQTLSFKADALAAAHQTRHRLEEPKLTSPESGQSFFFR